MGQDEIGVDQEITHTTVFGDPIGHVLTITLDQTGLEFLQFLFFVSKTVWNLGFPVSHVTTALISY